MIHRRWGVALAALLALACLPGQALAATPSRVLVLGDSVPFGYNPNLDPSQASNFVGFGEYYAQAHGLTAWNYSCPGEPSGHFLNAGANAYKCGPYRWVYPLHEWYLGTQMGAANAYLAWYKNSTAAAFLQLGANDYFRLYDTTCNDDATCTANGLPGVLSELQTNLTTIIQTLRSDGYSGPIWLANYPVEAAYPNLAQVNTVIGQVAQQTGVNLLDEASILGPNPCGAGYMVMVNGACDVHPNATGQQLIANAIE